MLCGLGESEAEGRKEAGRAIERVSMGFGTIERAAGEAKDHV